MPDAARLAGELERLSAVTLAASKDFNDELTFVVNLAEESLERLEAGHAAAPDLIQLQHCARRCAETARCLLLLSLRARRSLSSTSAETVITEKHL